MAHRWLFMFLYGLHLIWTGFQKGIEVKAYKPNALWFCLIMGLAAIAASFLFRGGRSKMAKRLSAFIVLLVFGFYLYCFVKAPEEDATLRVGLIMLSSIATGSLVWMPEARTGR